MQAEEPPLLDINSAFRLIMDHRLSLGSCNISLLESLGRVLASDQFARFDLPPHDHSAMDGYAFSFKHGQHDGLKICGFIPAGSTRQEAVPPGQAIRIMTGAPVPDGCDTVVPLENLAVDGDKVSICKQFKAGDNIRYRGEDIRAGELLLKAGTVLRPQEIALLSAMNIADVPVLQRARVAVLATGDELLEPGSELQPGKIINSNSNGLAAMLMDTGAEAVMMGIAKDTPAATIEKLSASLDADAILVTGGASAGDHDYVKASIESLGGEILFSGVKIKPGKPFGFALLKGRPLFIMPGNPVAAMIIFELFVRPMLLSAMGYRRIFRPRVRARLAEGFRNKGGRPHFVGSSLVMGENSCQATITGSQSSGRIASLVLANSLLYIPAEATCQPGDEVTALLLDGTPDVETEYQWD